MGVEVVPVDVRVMVALDAPVSAEDAYKRVETVLLDGGGIEDVRRLPVVAKAEVVPEPMEAPEPMQPQLGPYVADSETSREAAIRNYPRRGTQLRAVFEAVANAGDRGRTRDELHAELVGAGKPLSEGALDARVWELGPRRAGWIVPNGEKRLTPTETPAEVLVVSPLGWQRYSEEYGA